MLLVLGLLRLVIWEDLAEEMTPDFDLQVDKIPILGRLRE